MDISSLFFMNGRTMLVEGRQPVVDLLHHKVVVIIPSYNEERFIGSVVLKLLRYPLTIIVVDDGSVDSTADIAAQAGAIVVRQEKNQGKGAAINAGMSKARELNPEAVILIDADGQHLPEELARVVLPVLEGAADVVVGSRYIKQTSRVPANRKLAHLFFSWLTGIASGVALSDTQSGYRALSPRAFQLANFQSRGFSVESEMQFIARENGLTLVEVPITIRYQDPPKRSAMAQGLNVLNGILHLVGQYRPLLFFGLPGMILLLLGISVGIWVTDIYAHTQRLATGYGMICILLTVFGIIMLSTGMILHSIRGLLTSMLSNGK